MVAAKAPILAPLEALPTGLFWSAPMASDSDFNPDDPLALDYLGQQVGLWLFPGLTTRTTRAQYYAVVLYGLHLVERAIAEYGYHGDDATRVRLFERWERFWALAGLEAADGSIARGDPDSMRGVTGATRAWTRNKPLPLDFPMLSRQAELGSLGAYLSSLRYHDTVFAGTLRTAPTAQPIIDAFWDEPGDNRLAGQYDRYALRALDLNRPAIERKIGQLTLAKVGRKSRLSVLTRRTRDAQQQRLWEALFGRAPDESTLPLSEVLARASADEVSDPEVLLAGFAAGRWGTLAPAVASLVTLALAYGRVARALLDRFNRAYEAIESAGWVADRSVVAAAAFPDDERPTLTRLCRDLLDAAEAARFRTLEFHGPGFMKLLEELLATDAETALGSMLRFHHQVHRSRRGGGAWMVEESGKLTLQITSYRGHHAEAGFPGLKLGAVRSLLRDLGRIA